MFKTLNNKISSLFSKKQHVQPLSTEEEAELQAYYIEEEKKNKAAIDAQALAEFDKRAAAAAKRRAEATSNAAKLTSNTNAHPVVLQSVFQQENKANSDYLNLQNVVNSMTGPSVFVMMRKFLNGSVGQAGSIDQNQLYSSVKSYLTNHPGKQYLYNSYLNPKNYKPTVDNPERDSPLDWRYEPLLPDVPNKGGRTRRKGKRNKKQTNKRFNKKSHNKRYTKKR
jgi:hypothetical protein